MLSLYLGLRSWQAFHQRNKFFICICRGFGINISTAARSCPISLLPTSHANIKGVSFFMTTLLADLVPEDLLVTSLAYCAKKITIRGNAKSTTSIFTFIGQLLEQRDVALVQLQKGHQSGQSHMNMK